MYILTQAEYDVLVSESRMRVQNHIERIQQACTLAAMHAPAHRPWAKDNRSPWGCLLVPESSTAYCDWCPVQSACPLIDKVYSK